MIPNNIIDFDYQQIGFITETSIEKINNFFTEKKIDLDFVFSASNSGIFVSSIISKKLNLSLGYISKNDFYIPSDLTPKNILIVDIISHNKFLLECKNKILSKVPNANIFTFSLFVDSSKEYQPDIYSFYQEGYFFTPWNFDSLTPQSHLDRIVNGDYSSFSRNKHFLGFSSSEALSMFELLSKNKLLGEWFEVYDSNNKVMSLSQISTLTDDSKYTIKDYKEKLKPLIEEKAKFIKNNGITHYIENNLRHAIMISSECPICHVYYIENNYLYRLQAKDVEHGLLNNININ